MKEVPLEYCFVCRFLGTEEEPLVHVALPGPGKIANRTETKVHLGCWLVRLHEHIEESHLRLVVHKNKKAKKDEEGD
jgi:hypothetical protein